MVVSPHGGQPAWQLITNQLTTHTLPPWHWDRCHRAGRQSNRSRFRPDRIHLPGFSSCLRPRDIAALGEDIRPLYCGRNNPLTMTQIALTGCSWFYRSIAWPT